MSKFIPLNKKLYLEIKNEAKKKFKVWPSAYASMWLVKEYKKQGGTYKGRRSKSLKRSSGIDRWIKEKWINICKLPKIVSCGRSKLSKNWLNNYPVCRPYIRINANTPTLASEISKKEIKRICYNKSKSPLNKLKKIKKKNKK